MSVPQKTRGSENPLRRPGGIPQGAPPDGCQDRDMLGARQREWENVLVARC